MTSLYVSNDTFIVLRAESREEWLKQRVHGIGGSDAASAIGRGKWTTNVELWEYKTGKAHRENVENPAVIYGTKAESLLRDLYALDNEETFTVEYESNVILQNVKNPIFLYSPDGLLKENATGRKGILEIKTARTISRAERQKWENQIPMQYYIQVLHGLNVTGFDFVELMAQLDCGSHFERWTYHIDSEDVRDDMKMIADGINEFWTYVENGVEPPLWIN